MTRRQEVWFFKDQLLATNLGSGSNLAGCFDARLVLPLVDKIEEENRAGFDDVLCDMPVV